MLKLEVMFVRREFESFAKTVKLYSPPNDIGLRLPLNVVLEEFVIGTTLIEPFGSVTFADTVRAEAEVVTLAVKFTTEP